MHLVFLVLSCICIYVAARSRSGSKLPLAVYCVAYTVTTLIGAMIISLQHGGELWALYSGGLDTAVLTDYGSLKYVFLLYSPLIVCPLTFLLFSRLKPLGVTERLFSISGDEIGLLAFALVWILLFGYCFFDLIFYGYFNLHSIVGVGGDYVGAISLRAEIFGHLGRIFFGLLYMGLPTLSHVAFYQALRRRTWCWRGLATASVLLTSLFVLLTIQKAPLFVYFASLVIGYVVLKRARLWVFVLACIAGFVTLNAIQIFVLGDWSAIQSLYLVIFRMANSFPYYVNLFPKTLPYEGLDAGLDLFGLVPRPHRSEVVFNYMYPNITWVQGAAPAASHLDAYSQGGVLFALAALVLTGWYLSRISYLREAFTTSVGYALFVGGTIGAYYLTQTTLRDVAIASYGIVWVMVPVALLLAAERVLCNSVQPVRSLVQRAAGDDIG